MAEANTGERAVSRPRGEVINEVERIEEAAELCFKQHFAAASIWRVTHFVIGIFTVILAALAGAKAFSTIDRDGTIAGWLSIAVAVLSAVSTFLNASKNATEHLAAGNKYLALTNKSRIFRTIDCWGDSSDNALAAKVRALSDERATINNASPPLFWLVYQIAKWQIKRGQTKYAVDTKPGATAAPQIAARPVNSPENPV